MIKIVLYDKNCPFNSERTVPLFANARSIIFERRLPNELTESDIALIDSTMEYDMSGVKADVIIPFDCEDQYDYPDRINLSYYSILGKIKYYGKSAYRAGISNTDGLKYINMPHPFSLISRINMKSPAPLLLTKKSTTPIFYGSGTFIGQYNIKYPNQFKTRENRDTFFSDDSIKCLVKVNETSYTYSQRIDWLSRLNRQKISIEGGLILGAKGTNLSREWQEAVFGPGIGALSTHPRSRQDLLNLYKEHRIYLCPAGMGRWTTRLWDCAANDGVIISTDMHDYTILPEAPKAIIVKDGSNIVDMLSKVTDEILTIVEEQRSNRALIFSNTPEIIVDNFLKQIV